MLGNRRSTKKMAPHLSNPRSLLICEALSCEGVGKTFQTSLRKINELRPASDLSPSMLLYGTQYLFRTNFRRCHALLGFMTSSLASPIGPLRNLHFLESNGHDQTTTAWFFLIVVWKISSAVQFSVFFFSNQSPPPPPKKKAASIVFSLLFPSFNFLDLQGFTTCMLLLTTPLSDVKTPIR